LKQYFAVDISTPPESNFMSMRILRQRCLPINKPIKETTGTEAAWVRPRVLPSRSPFAVSLLLRVIILLCFVYTVPAQAGLKIYYLRHAEYGGNVVNQWKDKPKDEWPAYVGRGDMFTPKGKEQVAALTKKLLKNYHFDFIAVSPAWRTRNTIAPYLKEERMKAELWPELLEFNTLARQHDENLPPPSADLFSGAPLTLSSEDQGLFTLRDDNPKGFKIGKDPLQAAADRRAVVDKVIELIRKRFDDADKSILLVGHGNTGRILAEELTHEKKAFEVEPPNTAVWMAEEQPDGSFKLLVLNDKPFRSPATQRVHAAP
jgi:broad specificity phosphatase PhoE